MTIRKKNWKTKGGKNKTAWFIDITYEKPTGEKIRVRKVSQGSSRREAERYHRQLMRSLLDETYDTFDPADIPVFSEFAEEWFEDYVCVNNKPSTQRTRRSALDTHLLPFFGRMRLDEIQRREIAKFKRRLLDHGSKPKTVNNHLGILSSLLNTAVDWSVLEHKPKIKWMKTPEEVFDFLEFDEATRLLVAAAKEPEWHTFILTGLQTGMRLGELVALHWVDVDLVRGEIRVSRSATRCVLSSTKNGRTRTVPIPHGLIDVLRRHQRRTGLRGEFVFSGPSGEILSRDKTKHPLARACRRAGLRVIKHHTMRHTYASHLVMRGVPLKVVQELLGHATMEMTMRYAHLGPNVKNMAVQVFDTEEMFDLGRGAQK